MSKDIIQSIDLCNMRQEQLKRDTEHEKTTMNYLKEQLNVALEKEFFNVYGREALDVRNEYKTLVNTCSKSCGKGHYVKLFENPGETRTYIGKNLVDPGSSHTFLQPEFYEKCIPNEMICEAYKTIGLYIWVEPTPHHEYWGN